jgi:predicted lipoprotein with Yx(FWY)xxD motif
MKRRPGFVPTFSSAAGVVFAALVLALFLSGGVDSMPADAAPGETGGAETLARAATVQVGASDYGPMLFDGRGYALYAFTKDAPGASACAGECAAAWPPYLADGALHAGDGARQALLGTAERPDGALQVAYDGRPLYYYVGDREPGQVLCQNVVEFGGTWLVVRASGTLVR